MEMLRRGGIEPFDAQEGSHECLRVTELPDRSAWVENAVGMSLKCLDPDVYTPPKGLRYRVVWLDRDRTEQAKSLCKFMRMIWDVETKDDAVEMLAPSFDLTKTVALSVWKDRGAPVRMMSFESIILYPRRSARRLAKFFDIPPERVDEMAAAVRIRSTECYPGLLEADWLLGDSGRPA